MAAPCLGPGLNRVLQGRGRRPAEQALLAPLEVERLKEISESAGR
jgi:hypothetical protein